MQLVTYASNGTWHAGVLVENQVVDVLIAAKAASLKTDEGELTNRAIIQWPVEKQARLEETARTLLHAASAEIFLLEQLILGPPIPDPDKIICLGLNYRNHAEEAGFDVPTVPILFGKYRNTLAGPTQPIILPPASQEVDYEGELAVVICRRCKNVPAHEALDCVAGYMALNDVSARDLQFRTGQWLSGKSLDTFAPCGPALVINEIKDPQDLSILTRLNGLTMQASNTRDMIFPVADTIAYISQLMTLEPGDIIATGTPEGVGFKRKPPVFLHAGDVVEVEIEAIGKIRNPVI